MAQKGTIHNPVTFTHRGRVAKQNPLTGDWMIDLGERFGVYTCETKAGVKGLIADLRGF